MQNVRTIVQRTKGQAISWWVFVLRLHMEITRGKEVAT